MKKDCLEIEKVIDNDFNKSIDQEGILKNHDVTEKNEKI